MRRASNLSGRSGNGSSCTAFGVRSGPLLGDGDGPWSHLGNDFEQEPDAYAAPGGPRLSAKDIYEDLGSFLK